MKSRSMFITILAVSALTLSAQARPMGPNGEDGPVEIREPLSVELDVKRLQMTSVLETINISSPEADAKIKSVLSKHYCSFSEATCIASTDAVNLMSAEIARSILMNYIDRTNSSEVIEQFYKYFKKANLL